MNNNTEYNTDGKTRCEIWESIIDRIMTASIFHSDASGLFDFMAIKGYKRLHQYQSLIENMTREKLKKFYRNNHNKMLKEWDVTQISIIPEKWLDATREDVTPPMRKEMTSKLMQMYVNWEKESVKFYEKCAEELLKMGYTDDELYIEKMVVIPTRKELKCIMREYLEIKGMNFDDVALFDRQQKIHDNYKMKIKKIGEKYCK